MPDAIDILVEDLLAFAKTMHPEPTYPKDHLAGMAVPKGGSNCAKCEYLADNKTDCTNEHFQKWNGSPRIPGKIDEYCSDWFEAAADEFDAAGTSEGAVKGWDTRGRGRKLGPPKYRHRIQRERPHDPKSAIGQVMDMAQRKEGVKVTEAKEFLKAKGVREWVISFVRKGEGNGYRWEVIDDGKKSGVIRIGEPKQIPDEEMEQKSPEQLSLGLKPVGDSSSAEAHLMASKISGSEPLGGGVNVTELVDFGDGTKGVFKPEPPRRWITDRDNIPAGMATEREVAAWQVAKLVGMDDMVSPAVIRTVGGDRGALLEYQDGDVASQRGGDEKFDGRLDAERAAMFDFVIGNEDRHGENWIVSGEGPSAKLHLIDHGLSFPEGVYEDWYHARLLDHVKEELDDGRTPLDSGLVRRYVQAAPAISGTLKSLGFNADVIKGVGRRITILNDAEKWRDVEDE